MGAPPQCAVVIPTFDGAHLLSTCLETLLANPPSDCTWRIVVVDDASTDRTPELLAAYGDAITSVRQPRNQGFAHACNAGAGAAGDVDHLVFLNNDTVPVAGWLDALVADAAAHPEAAAIGAKLLFPDGTVQHAGVAIGHDGWPHHLYTGFPGEHPAVDRDKRVVAATAACLLVRRAAFEALGGFDAAFHNGYEDVDLCLRLGEAGHAVRYCPRSVVYHFESVTRWAEESARDTSHNDRLYLERWGDRVVPDDVEHYLADGLIDVEYGPYFPLRLAISPLLATVRRDGEPVDRIEQLLAARSAQVMELQAQRTRSALAGARAAPPAAPSPRPAPRRTGGEPRIVHRGAVHRLGAGPPRHLVSVLMPLMDAAEDLREILPSLLEQSVSTELEVVAVDSASRDDTVAVLSEFGATTIAIDPAQFDHGLTRNLAAQHARGDVLVFLNGRTRPAGKDWLAPLLAALDADPTVAGACSRIAPHPGADLLTRRDGEREASGSDVRAVKRIEDWAAYRALPVEQRRLLLNFHTVSAAIRADVLRRIPFRSVRAIGEDLLWSREVLEAGMALVHEPASLAYHSHDYSLREWLMRNVDDGIANRDVNERALDAHEADAMVRHMVAEDWAYLRDELGLTGDELERWQIQAALRRAAQVAGQWLGVNHASFPPGALTAFSRVENARRES
jgi:GT2 family glycosyltransferase